MIDLSSLVDEVLEHAKECSPNECCGLAIIFKGRLKYVKCKNMLQGDDFFISPEEYIRVSEMGEIVGVCHSHVQYPSRPSEVDLISCNNSRLPWLIVSILDGSYTIVQPRNYTPPYEGRVWIHQVQDCYTLIQDYYRQELGIILRDEHRIPEWWDKGLNLYEDNYAGEGLVSVPINSMREHDIILIKNCSPVTNHGGILLGNGQILHHCANRLSSRDVYGGYWRKYTSLVLRHKSLL